MATASVTFTFAANTLIQASQGNTNFADVIAFLNGSVIHKDATVAFTAVPSGPGTDPVSANQFTRKAYVDLGPSMQRIVSGSTTALTASYANQMAGNQLTLLAGTYFILASARTEASVTSRNTHSARIQNITDATTLVERDDSVDDATSQNVRSWSFFETVTIAGTKVYELQAKTGAVGGTQFSGPNLRLMAIRIRAVT